MLKKYKYQGYAFLALLVALLVIWFMGKTNEIVVNKAQASEIHFERVIAEVTGYSSEEQQTDSSPFISADGQEVHWGLIACPRSVSFGTIVEVAGESFTCGDRMAVKNDGNYDIWFPDRQSALRFGRIVTEVYVQR